MKKGSKTSSFGTSSRISHDSSTYYASRLYSDLPPESQGEPLQDQPFPPIFHHSWFSQLEIYSGLIQNHNPPHRH